MSGQYTKQFKCGYSWADIVDDEEDTFTEDYYFKNSSKSSDADASTEIDSSSTKSIEFSIPCWHFGSPKGCILGNKCKFSHADKNASIKIWKGKKKCKFYIQGRCAKGAQCEFVHEN